MFIFYEKNVRNFYDFTKFPFGNLALEFSLQVALSSLIIVLFGATAFLNPGFLELNWDQETKSQGSGDAEETKENSIIDFGDNVKGMDFEGTLICLKHCQTCQVWRPPRCHHCSLCDSCIKEFGSFFRSIHLELF